MTDPSSFHHLSTYSDRRRARQALLVRAAMAESERQAAQGRRDWPAQARCEVELRRLWRAFGQLGDEL
jgi:hypothetical protein